jgi:hypothetical protein
MDQHISGPREVAVDSGFRSESRRAARRPMTRMQEVAVLAGAFAVGLGLQIAYLLNGTPTLP